MLVEERIAALERALALVEAQLARPEMPRAELLEQRKGIEVALARARRKKALSL